jgi:hypothetical protein
VLLFVCSAILAAIAALERWPGGRYVGHWLVLALLLLGLSIDEQAKLHDASIGAEVREHVSLTGPLYFGWVLIAAASLAAVAMAYRRFIRALPDGTRRRLFVATALYVTGEVGLEMIGGWYVDGGRATGDLDYAALTAVEEFLGLVGVILALSALVDHALARIRSIRFPPRGECAFGSPGGGSVAGQGPERDEAKEEHRVESRRSELISSA